MQQIKLFLVSMIFLSLIFGVGCGSSHKPIDGVSEEFSKDVWEFIEITTEELRNFDPTNDNSTVGKGTRPFLQKYKNNISTAKEQEIYDLIDKMYLYIIGKPTQIEKGRLEDSLEIFKDLKFKLEKAIQ